MTMQAYNEFPHEETEAEWEARMKYEDEARAWNQRLEAACKAETKGKGDSIEDLIEQRRTALAAARLAS